MTGEPVLRRCIKDTATDGGAAAVIDGAVSFALSASMALFSTEASA
jgi:hypothetical protein